MYHNKGEFLDILSTPPEIENDLISGHIRYAIEFDIERSFEARKPEMLSKLFISTKAVYMAVRHPKRTGPWQ